MTGAGEKRMRTCIACGKTVSKGELARMVRTASGAVELDLTGRAPGRGAYVCSQACLEKALQQGKVQKALRCRLSDGDEKKLREGAAAAMIDGEVR